MGNVVVVGGLRLQFSGISTVVSLVVAMWEDLVLVVLWSRRRGEGSDEILYPQRSR